jgi:PAS domain S-box-containing protein
MSTNRFLSAIRKERLGLMMILASLLVIMVTVFLLFSYQQKDRETHIREQGTNLARILTSIPYDQLTFSSNLNRVFTVLQHNRENTAFAYLAIVDADDKLVSETTSPGIIVPTAPLPEEPSAWLGERHLMLPTSERAVMEYHAPLFDDGELRGHARLGYFSPALGLNKDQIPLLATFALPIFLLTPLFYFLIKRELRPISLVNSQLDKLIENSTDSKVVMTNNNDLNDLMTRVNETVNTAQQRIGQLETERTKLITSTKLLSYKRSRIESILQSLPDAVMMLDESGSVSLVNDKVCTILGVSHENIISKKPAAWCSNPEIVSFIANHECKMTRGCQADSMEFISPAFPDKTIAISPYPLFSHSDNSQIIGTLIIFHDITAEKLSINRSSEFVAHLAHELKTPLNTLAMYSETLQGEDGSNEEFRIDAANVIHDEVERLSLLINNILSITKIEMGSIGIERKRLKLGELLQDAFATCARSGQEKNIDFRLDIPSNLSPISMDKGLIRIAINNLLSNAIKYSDPGGAVTLTAEESDHTLRISVRDEGIGIAPEDQKRIFEKFYRSDTDSVRAREGHGLGLPLAREIIQIHHGTLSVTSKPGEGSEFIATFNKETEFLKQAS